MSKLKETFEKNNKIKFYKEVFKKKNSRVWLVNWKIFF